MTRWRLLGIVSLCALACSRPPAADLVVRGGTVYTLGGDVPADPAAEPTVEAFAVHRGRIVAAGSAPEVARWTGAATTVLDLEGATVLPGFVDCHVHLANLGRRLHEVDLAGTRSWDEVVERVATAAAEAAPGAWITGRGWDQNDWPVREFPDHAALSRAVPEHPVLLRRVDGHAVIANAAALARAGVAARTASPPGGAILRRADGSPTGVLVDAAVSLVGSHVPAPTRAEVRAHLVTALDACARAGLSGVHDAGMDADEVAVMRDLLAEGALPLRVYGMWDATPDAADGDALQHILSAGPVPFDSTMHFALRAAKLMVDGALGSRGAALLAPYSDADTRGLPRYTPEAFAARAAPLAAAGFQLATHCIGDAANRMVLDVYERILPAAERAPARLRIEHAQVLAPEDVPRFAALGVVPSMQPTHCTSDMPWAPDRLGPERVRGAYAWRSLRRTGVVIAAGSDAPVESVEPLLGIHAAITRQDPVSGHPEGGWNPDERLSRSEAVRAFTVWAAYASFTEADLGTLQVGKRADFVVLDTDPLQSAPEALLRARVVATYVGGRAVHGGPAGAPGGR